MSLIKLLDRATGIDPARILCSSVPGHELPGGVLIDTRVRKEILTVPIFIALLTRKSLKSTYVLFELGARWGYGVYSETDVKFIPLLAGGLNKDELREPLRRFKAHSCDKESDLHQLIDEVCSELGLNLRSPSFYRDEMKALRKHSARLEKDGREKLLGKDPTEKPVGPDRAHIERENMKICLRKAWWEDNKKRNWRRVDKMADHCRISEEEALRLLQSMSDMIVSNTPDGHKITKKKF